MTFVGRREVKAPEFPYSGFIDPLHPPLVPVVTLSALTRGQTASSWPCKQPKNLETQRVKAPVRSELLWSHLPESRRAEAFLCSEKFVFTDGWNHT